MGTSGGGRAGNTGGTETGGWRATGGWGEGGMSGMPAIGGWNGTGGAITGGWKGTGGHTETGGWTGTGGWATGGRGGGGWGGGGWGWGGGGWGGGGARIEHCIPGQSVACACPNGLSGAQTCSAEGLYEPCVCAPWEEVEYRRVKNGMVGTWEGTQSNPWTSPCPVRITFEKNGHYSDYGLEDSCSTFYYGANGDSPKKTYRITDVTADGYSLGEVTVVFQSETSMWCDMKRIALSQDEMALSFEVWNGTYGPVAVKLQRLIPVE